MNGAARPVFLADMDCGNQGAHTDSGGAQVVDLIDLQAGVDLVRAGEDVAYLIGGDGIHAAAEGIQLNEVQIIPGADISGGLVKAGVIHPLIQDNKRALGVSEVRNRILGENGKAIGIDHLRNAVIDFGIQMIRASCKNDAVGSGILHELQNALALCHEIPVVLKKLLPCIPAGVDDLVFRKLPELTDQSLRDGLKAGERHVGVTEAYLSVHDVFHIVLDILRVCGDDGAVVVVVRILILFSLIEQRRIENKIRMRLFNQPLHMSVGDFGRIAF